MTLFDPNNPMTVLCRRLVEMANRELLTEPEMAVEIEREVDDMVRERVLENEAEDEHRRSTEERTNAKRKRMSDISELVVVTDAGTGKIVRDAPTDSVKKLKSAVDGDGPVRALTWSPPEKQLSCESPLHRPASDEFWDDYKASVSVTLDEPYGSLMQKWEEHAIRFIGEKAERGELNGPSDMIRELKMIKPLLRYDDIMGPILSVLEIVESMWSNDRRKTM